MDRDAALLHKAALLHDFAELLLWLRAPDLALEMQRRQREDPTLRCAVVQRALLNFELDKLEHALMLKWRLPALLVELTDAHVTTQVRNVQLAIRVARHSAAGWDNAAPPYGQVSAGSNQGDRQFRTRPATSPSRPDSPGCW